MLFYQFGKKNPLQFQLWSDTFLVLQFYFIHTGRAFILNALKDNFKKSHHFHANKKRKNISQINWSRHSLNFFTFKGRHFWISSLESSLSMFFCTTSSSLSSRVGDATFLKRVFHYHICVFLSVSDTGSANFDVNAQAVITMSGLPPGCQWL